MRQPKAIAIDCETTGTDFRRGCQTFSVAACDVKGKTWFWRWPVDPFTRGAPIPSEIQEDIEDLLATYAVYVFHNAKFDTRALAEQGIFLPWNRVEDTMLMSHCLDSGEPHGLKPLALKYLDILTDDESDLRDATVAARRAGKKLGWSLGKHVAWDYWMPEQLTDELAEPLCDEGLVERYNVMDAVRTIQLYKLFSEQLRTQGLTEQYEYEKRLIPVVVRMEDTGLSMRPRRTKRLLKELEDKAKHHAAQVRSFAPTDLKNINPNSGKQLSELFKGLGYRNAGFTPSGLWKTDAESLQTISDRNEPDGKGPVNSLIAYKTVTTAVKYLKSYVQLGIKPLPKMWPRLHASYNQTGTATTRFSASDPNTQNVSKGAKISLRPAFGPEPGFFWLDLDYDQLELRIIAKAANETAMLKAFKDGRDIHQETADRCGVNRAQGKAANFATVYMAGDKLLTRMTGVEDMGQRFREAYPEITRFQKEVVRQVQKRGWVETLLGYRLYPPEDRPYAGVDYIVQGTAGGVVKRAMLSVDQWLLETGHSDVTLCANIHDELVYEFSLPIGEDYSVDLPVMSVIKQSMEAVGSLIGTRLPVTAKLIRTDWSKGKEIKL